MLRIRRQMFYFKRFWCRCALERKVTTQGRAFLAATPHDLRMADVLLQAVLSVKEDYMNA
eukprot:6431676-Amphidinium_carterae.1